MAKTSSLLSTISYNSYYFLLNRLNTLIYLGEINYFEFIQHYPDTDDKKKHFHVLIFPNKSQDLQKLQKFFLEPCCLKTKKRFKIKKLFLKDLFYKYKNLQHYENHFKPLQCMPFWKTLKYGDWYWYSIHDKDFLRSKMLTRFCFYNDSDIVSSDYDFHNHLLVENPKFNFCKMGDSALVSYALECAKNQTKLSDILSTGLVPLPKTQQFCLLYNQLFDSEIAKSHIEIIRKQNKIKDNKQFVMNFKQVNDFELPLNLYLIKILIRIFYLINENLRCFMFDFSDIELDLINVKEYKLFKTLDFKLFYLFELKRLLDKNNLTLEKLVEDLKKL